MSCRLSPAARSRGLLLEHVRAALRLSELEATIARTL
jgi:hypothetical protein